MDRLDSYTWSSHKGYLSDAKKWSWLHKDYVLKMFSENRVESRKRYRKFIVLETPEEINQPALPVPRPGRDREVQLVCLS